MGEGYPEDWAGTLDRLRPDRLHPHHHGSRCRRGRDWLETFRGYVGDMVDAVRHEVAAGATLDQVKERLPAVLGPIYEKPFSAYGGRTAWAGFARQYRAHLRDGELNSFPQTERLGLGAGVAVAAPSGMWGEVLEHVRGDDVRRLVRDEVPYPGTISSGTAPSRSRGPARGARAPPSGRIAPEIERRHADRPNLDTRQCPTARYQSTAASRAGRLAQDGEVFPTAGTGTPRSVRDRRSRSAPLSTGGRRSPDRGKRGDGASDGAGRSDIC